MSSKIDMTTGSLGNKIIQYAIPLAITGFLQQLFNAADIAVVGRFAGKEAMAAVGSNAPLIGLLVNLFVGISLGSNVVIAKAIGQKNNEKVSKAVHTSIIIAVVGGILMTLLGEGMTSQIVRMLEVPAEVFDLSVKYLRIYFLGMPVIFLYNFEAAIFRSDGNTKMPLTALTISGILNVLLNMWFVIILGMDVDGVAIATVVSNAISSAILFVALIRTRHIIGIQISRLRVHMDELAEILRIGVPAGIQSAIFAVANIIIQSAINSLGTTIMAAASASYNLEIIAYYITNAFGQACTTFVGQNYGAGKNERCTRALKICLFESALSALISCSVILFFSHQLLGLFNTDPEVIAAGRTRMQIMFFSYITSFGLDCFSGYLRGFGISTLPAVATVLGICVVRLFWIFCVFRVSPTFNTIMIVYPLSLTLTTIIVFAAVLYIRPARKFRVQ